MTTLQTIAKAAGVSVGMVSRTLNNRVKGSWPRSAMQVERIRTLARDMGYRPHAGARSARTRAFKSIGLVIVRPFADKAIRIPSFNAELVDGVLAVALERDFRVSLVCTDCYPEPHADTWPRLISEICVDGLILTDFAPPQLQANLRKAEIPAIWLNTNRRTRTDTISSDDFTAARELTERMLALGHRRLAFAGPSNALHYSVGERRRGFAAALQEAGVCSATPLDANIPDSDFDEVADRLFGSRDRPTAVIAYSPHRAVQIERAARRAGLDVPRDVSLATWFDSAIEQQMTPVHYAGMNVDRWGAGHAAATLLFERMAAGKPCKALVRQEAFLEGDSMRPPPRPQP
jgi:DNA-binding LacI/PurR family transcriptional regulator